MKKNNLEIQRLNLGKLYFGQFICGFIISLLSIYLPFFLKEKGLTILQIGFLFTLGLALGGFVFSVSFSKILRKIKLRTGLIFASIFLFIQNILLYIFPTSLGATAAKFSNTIEKSSYTVSHDVAMQHNLVKNKHRDAGAKILIYDSLGYVIGVAVGFLLVSWIGFRHTFLVFSILTLPLFFIFSNVSDETRFKPKKKVTLQKIPTKLKVVIFAELIYWFSLAASFALVITFLVTDYFSSSMFWIGALFVVLYLSIVLTTIFTKKYLDKFDLFKTAIFGMILLMLSAVVIIISKNLYTVLVGMILEGVGAAIWVPSKQAVYWKLIGKESIEKVSGYYFGWRGAASTLGPLFGGLLVSILGILAPFYFKIIITAVIIIIYISIMRKS